MTDLLMVASPAAAEGHVAQSFELARRLGGRLTGAFLRPAFPSPVYRVEGGWISDSLFRQMVAAQRSAVEAAETRVRADFMDRAARVGVRADWITIDAVGDLIGRARLSDLVIAPSGQRLAGADLDFDAGRLGLACGRPLVAISEARPGGSVGRRVMICWNGTRESARAWRDAWPIIMAADNVALAVVRPKVDFDDLADLRFRLSRWDRAVDAFVDDASDSLAPEVLRRRACEWGCDLLVMGFYGRSRLSEQLLGGVSREFMADPPCALLASH